MRHQIRRLGSSEEVSMFYFFAALYLIIIAFINCILFNTTDVQDVWEKKKTVFFSL